MTCTETAFPIGREDGRSNRSAAAPGRTAYNPCKHRQSSAFTDLYLQPGVVYGYSAHISNGGESAYRLHESRHAIHQTAEPSCMDRVCVVDFGVHILASFAPCGGLQGPYLPGSESSAHPAFRNPPPLVAVPSGLGSRRGASTPSGNWAYVILSLSPAFAFCGPLRLNPIQGGLRCCNRLQGPPAARRCNSRPCWRRRPRPRPARPHLVRCNAGPLGWDFGR